MTVSLVLLFGVITALLLRSKSLTVGPAIAVALFGFFLAGTNLGPSIDSTVGAAAHVVGQIRF